MIKWLKSLLFKKDYAEIERIISELKAKGSGTTIQYNFYKNSDENSIEYLRKIDEISKNDHVITWLNFNKDRYFALLSNVTMKAEELMYMQGKLHAIKTLFDELHGYSAKYQLKMESLKNANNAQQ